DTESVERQVPLVVARRGWLELVAERFIDIDEGIAALARASLDVAHDGLHRGVDVSWVRALRKIRNHRPRAANVVRRDLATDAVHLALGSFPAQLADVTAADF